MKGNLGAQEYKKILESDKWSEQTSEKPGALIECSGFSSSPKTVWLLGLRSVEGLGAIVDIFALSVLEATPFHSELLPALQCL